MKSVCNQAIGPTWMGISDKAGRRDVGRMTPMGRMRPTPVGLDGAPAAAHATRANRAEDSD